MVCIVLIHPLDEPTARQSPALNPFVENQTLHAIAAIASDDVVLEPASGTTAAASGRSYWHGQTQTQQDVTVFTYRSTIQPCARQLP